MREKIARVLFCGEKDLGNVPMQTDTTDDKVEISCQEETAGGKDDTN